MPHVVIFTVMVNVRRGAEAGGEGVLVAGARKSRGRGKGGGRVGTYVCTYVRMYLHGHITYDRMLYCMRTYVRTHCIRTY